MSVIAPPESPPEVQRPFDQGSEPSSTRVTHYRRWTRAQQVASLSMALATLVVVTAISVAGGHAPWESSVGELAGSIVLFTAVFMVVEPLWEGRMLRRRLAAAEPLPDGAHEIGVRLLEALVAPEFLLPGAALGALFGIATLIVGGGMSVIAVSVSIAVCVGRIFGLEILLRRIVERTEPERTFFVPVDPEPLDPPLLWRATPRRPPAAPSGGA